MKKIPFKPRGSTAQADIKTLKKDFDNTELRDIELALWRAVELHHDILPDVAAYRGEIYHQLALRAELRRDFTFALKMYDRSIEIFRSRSETLGLARVLRDKAICIAYTESKTEGLAIARQALALHDDDIANIKGKRQRQITETYVWRLEASLDSRRDLADLIEVALTPNLEFCLRDQQKLCEFLIPRVDAATRVRLKARLAMISTLRMRAANVALSVATMMIDVPIVISNRALRTLLRKE